MPSIRDRWIHIRIHTLRINIQVRQLLSVCISLLCLVRGEALGPAYRVSHRFCSADRECEVGVGEVCKWLFDGCDRGQCMCNPQTHSIDRDSGKCKPLKLGGDSCSGSDLCISDKMTCSWGRCECSQGRLTSDRMFCLETNQRLLGERCQKGRDTCLQKAARGYVPQDVQCSYRGVCRCREGFKEDGIRCSKWRIGESGCSQNHHCMGGALCLTGVCRCPNAYDAVAGNTKCAKRGAVTNLPLSESCDELNEKRYCGSGLICSSCTAKSEKKCIRYLISDDQAYINSSPAINTKAFTFLLAAFLIVRLVTS